MSGCDALTDRWALYLVLVQECLVDVCHDVQQRVAHPKQALYKTRHAAWCRQRSGPDFSAIHGWCFVCLSA